MDAMLLATTNFARLLLGSIFLANLALWVFRYSPAGQIGTLAMVLAMVAAWYSQGQYQHAAGFMDPNGHLFPSDADKYLDHMKQGNLARLCCAAATACAALCLVFG